MHFKHWVLCLMLQTTPPTTTTPIPADRDRNWKQEWKVLRKRLKNQHSKLKFVMKSLSLTLHSILHLIVFCEFSLFLCYWFFFVRSSVLLPSPLLVQRYPIFILLWYRKLLSSSFGTIGIRFQFRFENAFAFNRFCLSISALNIYLWMAWWCCHFSLETALPFNLGANLALSCVYCASHRISRTEKQIKNVCADDLHANVCLCVTQFPPKRNWQFCFLSCSMFSS